MTQPNGPGIQLDSSRLANVQLGALEESRGGANPFAAPQPAPVATPDPTAAPRPVDVSPEALLGYEPEAPDPEQAALEAKHGKGETFATQYARGALSALLSPGALLGLQHETIGKAIGNKTWEDFGRRVGESATGRSALESLGALFGEGDMTDAADRARIAVDEQEKAWPLLSTAAQVTGGVAFGVATGGLASGGATSLKTLATLGAVEGAGAGAQAAYDVDAPLTEVWTSALMGGTVGAGLAGAAGGVGKLAGRRAPRADLQKVFGEEGKMAGTFGERRVAEALGFTKRLQKKYGAEEVNQIARDIHGAHLADGRPIFPDNLLDAARMDRVDIAERLIDVHEETGAALGQLRQRASAWIDGNAPELRPSPSTMAARIEAEVVAPLKGGISPAADGFARQAQKVADKLRSLGDDISLEELAQKRIDLDPDIRFDAKAPDTMKRVRGIIEDDVVARMDAAASRMGEAQQYLPLKRQYTSYSRGLEAMEDAVAGIRGNNKVGLTDSILAAGAFASDAASGGMANLARGAVVGFGSKLIREKTPQIMAVLARRFSRIPVKLDVAVAGGREAHDALTALVRAKKLIQETAERAGPNAIPGAVAGNTAQEVAARELQRLAGNFEPQGWATTASPASPLARVLYRTQILDTVSNDLAATAERSVALRPSLDFDIDPAKLAKLTKSADGPEAIGLVQARVREIADQHAPQAGGVARAARDIPSPVEDEIPFEAYFGRESFHPERVDLDLANEIGVVGADYLRGLRQHSIDSLRKVDDLSRLDPVRLNVGPDGQVTLVDGRHRMTVAQERGETAILAKVHQYNGAGDVVGIVTTPISIKGTRQAVQLEPALEALNTADVAGAMAEGHKVARGLLQAGKVAEARALMATLGDDVFGEAGRVYRGLLTTPDDVMGEMSNPAKLRDALKTLELRGALSEKVAAEHRATLAAYEARKRLTGEAVPPDIRREMAVIEKAWSRGEENVTLDGTRLGRIVNVLDNMTETKVASKVAQAPIEQQVAETIKPALKNIEPTVRRGRGLARAGAIKGLPRLSAKERIAQYDERLDQLAQTIVNPDTEERQAAINTAPPEVRVALVQAQDQKLKTLMADMPKPKSESIHGPSMATLSSDDIRLGTAMWEATMNPLSVFQDFARGAIDPDKVSYAWKQYPGLQKMAQLGVLDMLQSQLSDEERSGLPDTVLTQLDLLLGFNGQLQSTVSVEFSTRMDQIGQELQQGSATPSPPARNLQLPTARPSLTERIAGARR